MGVKAILTPNSVALNRSSFIICPELASRMRIKMPRERVEWISACPMSRIFASYRAKITITEAVRPGWSCPVILISICSSLSMCSVLLVKRLRSLCYRYINLIIMCIVEERLGNHIVRRACVCIAVRVSSLYGNMCFF